MESRTGAQPNIRTTSQRRPASSWQSPSGTLRNFAVGAWWRS